MWHLPCLLQVCSGGNICLQPTCAVQIWCKSIFSCSDIPRVIFQNSPKYHEPPLRRVIFGSFEISRAGVYPKYPEETVLFPVYTTRQGNFALYVAGVIFTCKYFKFGLNTTGLSQSHFRNLSTCSIKARKIRPLRIQNNF